MLAKRGGATRKRSGTEVANEKVAEFENDDSLTPVLKSCNRIHHQYLHKADPQLHKRLVEMNIEPQLYALAWVRLMFGRQFHIEDVMCLWDGIFAAQSNVGVMVVLHLVGPIKLLKLLNTLALQWLFLCEKF